MSYGPVTARMLDAQWMLSSVSGIGLMHSCCDMDIVMPDVYDKLNMRENKYRWNFAHYQPDVVTVALGQNDGIQDSAAFSIVVFGVPVNLPFITYCQFYETSISISCRSK